MPLTPAQKQIYTLPVAVSVKYPVKSDSPRQIFLFVKHLCYLTELCSRINILSVSAVRKGRHSRVFFELTIKGGNITESTGINDLLIRKFRFNQ